MSAKEYRRTADRRVSGPHAAIDALFRDVNVDDASIKTSGLDHQLSEAESLDDSRLPNLMAKGPADLPKRIRINLRPVKAILDSFCDRNLPFAIDHPLVFQRPFKFLVYQELPIRKYLADLERKWDEKGMSVTFAPTNQNNDNLSDAGSVPYPMDTCHNHRTQGENGPDPMVDPKVDISSATTANKINASANYPKQTNEFFRQWDSRDSTDDGSKTVTLIGSREAVEDLRCLVRFMDNYVRPVQAQVCNFQRTNVRFSELWYIFTPGSLMFVKDRDFEQKVWRIVQVSGGQRIPAAGHWRPDWKHVSDVRDDGDEKTANRRYQNVEFSDFEIDCYYL